MTPEQERRATAQREYREAMALPTGAERDKAVRIWGARYPDFQPSRCGHCTGNNIERRRG